jgi:membrane protein
MAKANKPGFIFRVKDFFLKTLSGDFDETRKFQKRLQASIQFAIAAFRKFLDDEVLLRSASISYAIVVSFVPTLVVVMMVGSRFIDIELYFAKAEDFVRLNGLQVNLEPYFNIIREFLKNAGAIGGIGFLILLFSATSVLRNVEDSINKIWRVTRKRPMIQKISGFIMVMVFGPAVLAVGISFAQSMVSQFASPNFRQVRIIQDSVYILGDKHVFLVQSDKGKPYKEKNILKAIDYEAGNERIVFNPADNTLVDGARSEIHNNAPRADKAMLKKAVFMDYARIRNREFIITDSGILLSSADGGNTYTLRRFYRLEDDRVREVSFQRIQFLTENQGLIVGASGLILRTGDGGITWMPAYQKGVTANLRQVARLRAKTWLVLGDGSTALVTEDGGVSFSRYEPVTRALRNPNEAITGMAMAERIGYIVGEAGLLLMTRDAGESWKRISMVESQFFQDVAVAPDGSAVAVGLDGLIRYTQILPDGSIQWQTAKGIADVDLQAVRYYAKEGRYIIVGDHYQMLQQQHDAANPAAIKEFKVIQKAPFWRRLISALGNLLIPFVVIFLLFFLLYKIIPYTLVQTKAAATGATFTSISWVIFILIYKFYVAHFSKGTAALYGTLALVPLTLLMLYVSALIVLFGAEIAFFTQYPQLFRMSRKAELAERHKRQLWYGLSILHRLAVSFNKGKNDCTTENLIRHTLGDQEEFRFIMGRLVERGYVTETEDHKWLLAMNPDLIEISSLVEDLDPSDYSIPEFNAKDPYMRAVKRYFDQLQASRDKIFHKVTLSRLMQGEQV